MSDAATSSPSDREGRFLSRSLAAFAIAELARVDDRVAALSVVDEPQDDGIDAFYYDRSEHVCYLAQSKWMKSGGGSMDVSDVLKFVQGVGHFLDGSSLAQFGPKLRSKKINVNDVLADSLARFVLIVAYTGSQPLSDQAQRPLDELLDELNDDEQIVTLRVLRQKDLHAIVAKHALGESVNLTVMLHEWGIVRDPYRAYYGQVDVADIAAWSKFGEHLYTRNLRGYKGSTDVNAAIVATLTKRPEDFLYFNNGITILCESIAKQPLGGASRSSGVFELIGASVVNGAQTVGSIISGLQSLSGAPDGHARVLVRLVSLEKCPADFGFDMTRAANTQNKIDKRDFAALDEQQGRLKTELLLTFNKEYAYKTGDRIPPAEDGCGIDEATVALACAQTDLSYTMIAKREVSLLYDDITQPPYTVLFNASVSALRLWRAVRVVRGVEASLRNTQVTADGKERLIAIHGNRFIAYLVFRRLGSAILDERTDDVEKEIAMVASVTESFLPSVVTAAMSLYPNAYPSNLFKNATKCKELARAITAA